MNKLKTGLGRGLDALIKQQNYPAVEDRAADYAEVKKDDGKQIEIGLAYKRLMDECHLTQEQIADKVGKDRTTIANAIRLLRLPKEIQTSLINEEITAGHARAMINLPTSELQLQALKKILEGNLSVRKVEQLMKKLTLTNRVAAGLTKKKTHNKKKKKIIKKKKKIKFIVKVIIFIFMLKKKIFFFDFFFSSPGATPLVKVNF